MKENSRLFIYFRGAVHTDMYTNAYIFEGIQPLGARSLDLAPGLRSWRGWALYRTLCPISMIRPRWLLAYAFSLINKAGPWCFSEFLHLYICFYIYVYKERYNGIVLQVLGFGSWLTP